MTPFGAVMRQAGHNPGHASADRPRKGGRAREEKTMKKQLYDVYTNGRNHILVWCDDQMELERMVQNDKIREYVLATTYKVRELEEIAE